MVRLLTWRQASRTPVPSAGRQQPGVVLFLEFLPIDVVPVPVTRDYKTAEQCCQQSAGPIWRDAVHVTVHGLAAVLPTVFPTMPVQRGDVLFLTRWTVHSSLSNHSDEIHWSFDLRYHPIGQATGREAFPGFVARSRANPDSELHDAAA